MPRTLDKATLEKIVKITGVIVTFASVAKELCDNLKPVLGETNVEVIKIALICVPMACCAVEPVVAIFKKAQVTIRRNRQKKQKRPAPTKRIERIKAKTLD